MKNTLITIIVTVHNSENYLVECLDSLCNQTYQNIDILCVDGGSTDASPQILLDYAAKDKRVRILNDKNASYGHKINVGVENALGEYIGILESDDIMKSHMISELVKVIEEYHPDYVDSDYDSFFDFKSNRYYIYTTKYANGICYDKILDKQETVENLRGSASGAIWTGLYSKKLLMKHQIEMFESPGAAFQDTSFRFLVNAYAESSYHIAKALHSYRIDNQGSSVKDLKKVYTIAYEYDFLKNELEKRNVTDEKIWKYYYQWKYESYNWNVSRLIGEARDVFWEYYIKEIKKDIEAGNIKKDNQDASAYHNTFMLLETPEEYIKELETNSKVGSFALLAYQNLIEEVGEREIIVFGSGVRGMQIVDLYSRQNEKILCLCDNDISVQYTIKNGYEVLPVDVSINKYPQAVFVIANRKYSKEMMNQLLELGVSKDNIVIFKEDC